ncbi:T9SS type A sorting domain-containing protein, partial [Flavobacterium jejuense]|nr:T9SS type A sorting domain-containing protein [Flavobacterium jejuense]
DPVGSGTALTTETYNATGLTSSTTYYFHVRTDCGSGTFSGWSTFMFTTLASPPANNDLCNAIPLVLGAATTGSDYTLVAATSEANEPEGSCFNGGIAGSVWFSFVSPASGSVEITTDFAGGTLEDGDTEIAVYDGTGVTCSDLSTLPAEIDCDQDSGDVNTSYGSFLSLTGLTSGATYYIQVDSYGGVALGSFGIQVNGLLSSSAFNLTNFKAYPNPVKDMLNLEYTSDITSISIFNLLGQEVLSKEVNS